MAKWPFVHFPLHSVPASQERDETVVTGSGTIVYDSKAEGYIFL